MGQAHDLEGIVDGDLGARAYSFRIPGILLGGIAISEALAAVAGTVLGVLWPVVCVGNCPAGKVRSVERGDAHW